MSYILLCIFKILIRNLSIISQFTTGFNLLTSILKFCIILCLFQSCLFCEATVHNKHITSVCVVLCLQSTVWTRWKPFSDTATINTCCDCLQYTCLCKTLNSSHSNILLSSYFVIWLAGKIMIYMSKMSLGCLLQYYFLKSTII